MDTYEAQVMAVMNEYEPRIRRLADLNTRFKDAERTAWRERDTPLETMYTALERLTFDRFYEVLDAERSALQCLY